MGENSIPDMAEYTVSMDVPLIRLWMSIEKGESVVIVTIADAAYTEGTNQCSKLSITITT